MNNVNFSGTKLEAPEILRPTKSFPFPDLAAVRAADATKTNRIQPVFISGEGKVKRRGISDDDKKPKPASDSEEPVSNQPNARAQMAAAVHPTLLLLVLAHYKRQNLNVSRDGLAKNGIFPDFDEKSMVYGVYYDEQQIRIYTHFPQIEEVSGRFVIRFYQVLVEDFQLEDVAFLGRWRLAVALFCVQKHADLIGEELTDVVELYRIPKEG